MSTALCMRCASSRTLRRTTTRTASTTSAAFELDGEELFWKIDCSDYSMKWGSPDPADPNATMKTINIIEKASRLYEQKRRAVKAALRLMYVKATVPLNRKWDN